MTSTSLVTTCSVLTGLVKISVSVVTAEGFGVIVEMGLSVSIVVPALAVSVVLMSGNVCAGQVYSSALSATVCIMVALVMVDVNVALAVPPK